MPAVDAGGVPVRPGDTIADRYLVTSVVASGGMGFVVAARDRHLQRTVAVKLLREGMSARDGVLARFEREGRVIAALTGEHIAKVFDFGRLPSGEPFIVMELLEGETLGERVRRVGRLPVKEAVTFVLQTCEGLAEAHAAGIVHRDLKPDNLFVCKRMDDSESIKIIDFGISKAREGLDQVTVGTEMIGTPAYMSPEQLEAPASVDERADVWSLGAVLYKLLSGKLPFAVEGVMQIVSAIVQTEPAPLASQGVTLPDGLAEVVDHALRKDRRSRFATVVDFAAALMPYAGHVDASAGAAQISRLERITRNRSAPSLTRLRVHPDETPTAAEPVSLRDAAQARSEPQVGAPPASVTLAAERARVRRRRNGRPRCGVPRGGATRPGPRRDDAEVQPCPFGSRAGRAGRERRERTYPYRRPALSDRDDGLERVVARRRNPARARAGQRRRGPARAQGRGRRPRRSLAGGHVRP